MTNEKELDRCEYLCVHEDAVKEVLAGMPDDDTLFDLAELYKLFGDTTRVRILYALFGRELCVCDIARILGLTQTAVSHQLRLLRAGKLVKARRDGKIVFYSLDDDHVGSILGMGISHLSE